jgi:hypothetical protein
VGCFPASDSLLVPVSGCLGSDGDFDGPPYLNDWPGTGSARHDAKYEPQPITKMRRTPHDRLVTPPLPS